VIEMTENKLEKIVNCVCIAGRGVGTAVKGTAITAVVVGALGATVGALGAGVYEGYTGQKIFGAENTTMVLAAAAGYGTPILMTIIPEKEETYSDRRGRDDAFLGAVICPIGPAVSMALYGAGYGIGYLFK